MKSKPDDRSDNVKKIQYNINRTIEKMEAAEDMLEKTDNEEQKRQIQEKNERRRQALEGMREEIAEEARYQKNKKNKE